MNKRVIKTAIIISWIVLAVCFIIKIIGGKWFNIATNNKTFISVCAFIDKHLWLQDIIAFATSLLVATLLNLAVLKQRKFKLLQFIIVVICVATHFAVAVVGEYLQNKIISIISFALGIIPTCICPMILSRKPLRSIVACALYLGFQGISVVIKGLAITQISNESSLVSLIFSIDVYIMLILYYLYANLVENNKNKINEKGEN